MGVKSTGLAGPTHRFCVISAGETGKSCREFAGARLACRGTPKSGYTIYSHGCTVRTRTEIACAEEEVRFGREPKCVRGKTVIPWTDVSSNGVDDSEDWDSSYQREIIDGVTVYCGGDLCDSEEFGLGGSGGCRSSRICG